MGYTTDFIGHLTVSPALNVAEQLYLTAFAESRRCVRVGGPYDVPGNPAAEHDDADRYVDAYNRVADGQPSLWCGWRASWDGEVITHDGVEKFYGATDWLRYLVDHFLAPGAYARRSKLPFFTNFTFDHQVDGIIAAHRRDTSRLYLITVESNCVDEETLVAGDSEWPPELLPYQEARDAEACPRTRRRAAG